MSATSGWLGLVLGKGPHKKYPCDRKSLPLETPVSWVETCDISPRKSPLIYHTCVPKPIRSLPGLICLDIRLGYRGPIKRALTYLVMCHFSETRTPALNWSRQRAPGLRIARQSVRATPIRPGAQRQRLIAISKSNRLRRSAEGISGSYRIAVAHASASVG